MAIQTNIGGINYVGFYTVSSGTATLVYACEKVTSISAPTGSISSGSIEMTISNADNREEFTTFESTYSTGTTPTAVEIPYIDGTKDTVNSKVAADKELLMLTRQNALGGKYMVTALNVNVNVTRGAIDPEGAIVNEIAITAVTPDAQIALTALPADFDTTPAMAYTSGDITIPVTAIGTRVHQATS